MIDVFKFGGASINSAERIQNVAQIVKSYSGKSLVLVISASGKMTNAFEKLLELSTDTIQQLNEIVNYHQLIINELNKINSAYNFDIYQWVNKLKEEIDFAKDLDYNQRYDQVVSFGELISSQMVAEFLRVSNINVKWLDARDLIKTDSTFREAKIDWLTSTEQIINEIQAKESLSVFITQGFIASDKQSRTTTLGREGSDFTAAILGYCLDAHGVTIWKDVAGVLNADPRLFSDTQLIQHLSYREAIEMTYYGAQVIHPKTIKPLQNKSIPLHVRSFLDTDSIGTIIDQNVPDRVPPIKVIKHNQCMWQISTRDFAFIVEDHLSAVYKLFAEHEAKINVLQNTAISLSICLDDDPRKNKDLLNTLREMFDVVEIKGLELLTIRHYTNELVDQIIEQYQVLLEERIRQTCRLVIEGQVVQ